jgi:hypothetical protein
LRNLKNNEDLVQIGAQERTRTSTPLRELAPESTFGITRRRARNGKDAKSDAVHWIYTTGSLHEGA